MAFVQDLKTFGGKLRLTPAAGLEEFRLQQSGKVNSAHNLSTNYVSPLVGPEAVWVRKRTMVRTVSIYCFPIGIN